MSLFVSCIPVYHHNWLKRQESPTNLPEMKRISLNVLLVLACFVCTRIMVVLQYRNLLLLCGGISKPVVQLLVTNLLLVTLFTVCMLFVWTRRHLHSPLTFFCAWCNNDWNWVECCVQDAHLRVWRATIKQDYIKVILLLKPLLMTSMGNLKRTS